MQSNATGAYGLTGFHRKEAMQKTYELMVLLHPDLEIDVEAPITKVEALVAAVNGKVLKRDNWGKKRLAYRVSKQDFAIYVYFELSLAPESVQPLDTQILITEEILRHILVVHEENPPRVETARKDPSDTKSEPETEKETKSDVKAQEGDK
jgi:small subunit ribosomal protein S6